MSLKALTTTSWCAESAATSDWDALISPTDTPWTRTRGRSGSGGGSFTSPKVESDSAFRARAGRATPMSRHSGSVVSHTTPIVRSYTTCSSRWPRPTGGLVVIGGGAARPASASVPARGAASGVTYRGTS